MEEGQSRFISSRKCLLGQVISKCHHYSGPAWRSSMMIGDIQQCNLRPHPAISFSFFLCHPHFQFHLQFLLLSSCLAITLCPSLPLYFLMEMFYIWSTSSTFMDVCPSSSLKRIRQQLVWDWGQMGVWETVTLWLGQLVNHGHHSNLKRAQCKPLCISCSK